MTKKKTIEKPLHESQFTPIGIIVTRPQLVPASNFNELSLYFVLDIPSKTDRPQIRNMYHCAARGEVLQEMLDCDIHRGDVIQIRGRVFYPYQAMVSETKHIRSNRPVPEQYCFIDEWRFMYKVRENKRREHFGKNSLNEKSKCMPHKQIYQMEKEAIWRNNWDVLHGGLEQDMFTYYLPTTRDPYVKEEDLGFWNRKLDYAGIMANQTIDKELEDVEAELESLN